MTTRRAVGVLVFAISAFGSVAKATVVGSTCNVTVAGWREDIKALKVTCGTTTLWNREATANPSCALKTSEDTIKVFQTTANAALLSGKQVTIFFDTETVCSTDPVIREMYLLH